MKNDRYIIKSWVCDYGVWDTYDKEFVSIPLSYNRAKQVLDIYNKEQEGELLYEKR